MTILRKKYRNAILGAGGLLIAAIFSTVLMQQERFSEIAMVTGLLLLIGTEGSIYLHYHKKMKILKTEKGWMVGKVQTLVADTTAVSAKECASPAGFLFTRDY
jgi:hypothetical protein